MKDARSSYLRGILIDVYPFSATDESLINAEKELDLVPSSMEGIKVERAQSDARMKNTAVIGESLAAFAVWSAEAVTQYMLDQVKDPDAPRDRIREIMVVQNAQVIGIAVQSIIAQLLESGVLEYKKG